MIRITSICEECMDEPAPGWVTAEDDKRIYSGKSFGLSGDSWATIITVYMEEENRLLKALVGGIDYFRPYVSWPVAEVLQLRVCSPQFVETDPRFIDRGRHRALIQERFDYAAAKEYCASRVRDSAHLDGPSLIAAWERDFYVFDPDDD